MNKGFTLIELLVVVLIIGILSSIALPQYIKAVEKSRATEAVQLLGQLASAEKIYQMANNEYTTDLSNLDVGLPGVSSTTTTTTQTKNFTFSVTKDATTGTLTAEATRANNGVATTGDNKYKITMTLTTAGVLTKTCKGGTSYAELTAMCKSISNGDSNGEIK